MRRRADLLEDLRTYTPIDALEEQHHRAIAELLLADGDPFSRRHFDPGHVTASCFILDPTGTRLLLHHHRRLDRWLQMGGHLEGGESPVDAAMREGVEESGLRDLEWVVDGVFDLDVHAIPAGKGEPDHHHFDIRYLARTTAPESIAIDPNESKELAWTELDRAIEMMNEEASSRVVHKIARLMRDRRVE